MIANRKSLCGRGGNSGPADPTYFPFAGLASARHGGNAVIVLLPSTDRAIEVGQEIGVKIGITVPDRLAQPIDLRLKVQDGGSLSIDSWELNKKAVGDGGTLAYE